MDKREVKLDVIGVIDCAIADFEGILEEFDPNGEHVARITLAELENLRISLAAEQKESASGPSEIMCRNYKNEMVKAPADLKNIAESAAKGYIVWSFENSNTHQVRYGLQISSHASFMEAAKEFQICKDHYSELGVSDV